MTRINKGIRFEYKIRDKYLKMGYEVIRSAGSRGNFDLIAIHKEKREIIFMQLKRGSKLYLSKQKDRYDCKWIKGLFECKFEMVEQED